MLSRLITQLESREAEHLCAVLDDLVDRMRRVLGGDLVGLYLTGSFALDAGDLHADVDFVGIVRGSLSTTQEAGLREAHASLPDRAERWARVLEGSYVPVADLRQRAGTGPAWLYVDNGHREMSWSTHDDSEVTRWVLRNRAVAVSGPPAGDLVPEVPRQALRDEAATSAVARTGEVAEDPDYLTNAWGQPHEVLTRCRMLYTASTAEVIGKAEAARWCLDVLPRRWHDLVRRAVVDRPDPWGRVHRRGDPELARRTWEFVEELTPAIVDAARGPLRAAYGSGASAP